MRNCCFSKYNTNYYTADKEWSQTAPPVVGGTTLLLLRGGLLSSCCEGDYSPPVAEGTTLLLLWGDYSPLVVGGLLSSCCGGLLSSCCGGTTLLLLRGDYSPLVVGGLLSPCWGDCSPYCGRITPKLHTRCGEQEMPVRTGRHVAVPLNSSIRYHSHAANNLTLIENLNDSGIVSKYGLRTANNIY